MVCFFAHITFQCHQPAQAKFCPKLRRNFFLISIYHSLLFFKRVFLPVVCKFVSIHNPPQQLTTKLLRHSEGCISQQSPKRPQPPDPCPSVGRTHRCGILPISPPLLPPGGAAGVVPPGGEPREQQGEGEGEGDRRRGPLRRRAVPHGGPPERRPSRCAEGAHTSRGGGGRVDPSAPSQGLWPMRGASPAHLWVTILWPVALPPSFVARFFPPTASLARLSMNT